MPQRITTRTAVPGATANDRRYLAAVNSTSTVPSAKSDGVLLSQTEFLHLLFKTGGTTPVFTLLVWWYSEISGMWHAGEALTVNGPDMVTIEIQGMNRVYLQVTNVTGTLPTLDAWIALVVPT